MAVTVAVPSPSLPSVSTVMSTSFLSPTPAMVAVTGLAVVTPVTGSAAMM